MKLFKGIPLKYILKDRNIKKRFNILGACIWCKEGFNIPEKDFIYCGMYRSQHIIYVYTK